MEREIVVLAVTRMLGGVCVAGVCSETGEWIRPVRSFGHLSVGDVTYGDGQIMRPFDVVRLNLLRARPQPPHVEDWEGDFGRQPPRLVGRLDGSEREALLRRCLEAGTEEVLDGQRRSLGLVAVQSLRATFSLDGYSGRFDARILLADPRKPRDLPCTDLRWRSLGRALLARHRRPLALDEEELRKELGIGEVFVAIGLGRPFHGRCWPLAIGVHTLPDYIQDFDPLELGRGSEQETEVTAVAGATASATWWIPAQHTDRRPPAFPDPPAEGLLATLGDLFGYESFREGQEAVIRNALAGLSTLAVMPTGAGKSLCYQLPAMLLPGVTAVISPLIALMKDQVDSLSDRVRARTTFVNSSLESEELARRLGEIADGQHKLVYAAPERLRQMPFLHALNRAGISLLVVDEAHCVDLWGHDFRPDYLFIAQARALLGKPPLLALTATATPAMRARIGTQLGETLRVVATGFFRPNLHLAAAHTANDEEKMRELLRLCRAARGPAIVYVNAREKAEELARLLRREGISAAFYHAGMEAEPRRETQERYMAGQVRVIVATTAFGMGIDKPDVRLILHYHPPRSLESYAQEAGRAGRDGQLSRCVLLYSASDKANLTRWARESKVGIDVLRAVYKVIRDRLRRPLAKGLIALGDLTREVNATGGAMVDDETVRIAVSMLEQADLVRRFCDTPRAFSVDLLTAAGDEEIATFVRAARLRPRQTTALDSVDLAARSGVPLEWLEAALLRWEDQGLLNYRAHGREMLLELLPPPSDSPARMAQLLYGLSQSQEEKVAQIVDYGQAKRCRQAILAGHFGDAVASPCEACDVCRPAWSAVSAEAGAPRPGTAGPPEPMPALAAAEIVLRCMRGLPFAVGKRGLLNVLHGAISAPIKRDRCPDFGALAGVTRHRIEVLIDCLVAEGCLAYYKNGEFRLLQVTGTPPGRAVARLSMTSAPRRAAQDRGDEAAGATDNDIDQGLCDVLRSWRRREAERQGVAPFLVLSDAAIREIAAVFPRDEEALAQVRGIGPAKMAAYGQAILRAINRAASH